MDKVLQRKLLILISFSFFVGLSLWACNGLQLPFAGDTHPPLPSKTPFLPAPATSTATAPPPLSETWNLIHTQIDASRSDLNVSAAFNIPMIDHSYQPNLSGFNADVQDYVRRETNSVFSDLTLPLESPGGFLNINYEVTSAPTWSLGEISGGVYESPGDLTADEAILEVSHPVVSILFDDLSYLGGAHPSARHESLNYDLQTGQRLTMGDLFRSDADYLQTIADFSIQQLSTHKQDLFDDYAVNGAAPEEDNYKVWALTPRGLLIIFEEYQVGPYASGPQYALIPYEDLGQIINPHGVLGIFAR